MIRSDKKYLKKAIIATVIFSIYLWLNYTIVSQGHIILALIIFAIVCSCYGCFMFAAYLDAKEKRNHFKTTASMSFEKLHYLFKQEDKK